jgi:hypothetical protein
MGKSASKSYVTWVNRRSSGDWATWEPGDRVSPGDVGRFNKELRFLHWQTLQDFGIQFTVSDEQPVGGRMYATGKDFNVRAKLAGQSAAGFSHLGNLDAGLKITAKKEHASLLQIRDATESHIIETEQLLQQLAAVVRRPKKWDLDLMVVFERTRAARGFAAISQGRGQSLELKAAAGVQFSEDLELGDAELSLASGKVSSDFLFYEFGQLETPVFGPPIRVRRDLLDRLLPWKREGPYLIDPAGGRHDVNNLPNDLSNFAEADRRYDPERSAMRPAELAAMNASDLFERVTSLDENQTSPGGTPAVLEAGYALREEETFTLKPDQMVIPVAQKAENRDKPMPAF